MTQEEINELKHWDKAILFHIDQPRYLSHQDLEEVVLIIWKDSPDSKFVFTKIPVNDPSIIAAEISDVTNINFLILNPHDEGRERVYKIIVNKHLQKLELQERHPKDRSLESTFEEEE